MVSVSRAEGVLRGCFSARPKREVRFDCDFCCIGTSGGSREIDQEYTEDAWRARVDLDLSGILRRLASACPSLGLVWLATEGAFLALHPREFSEIRGSHRIRHPNNPSI